MRAVKKKKIEHRYKNEPIFKAFIMPQSKIDTPFGNIVNKYDDEIEVTFTTRVRISYNGKHKKQ